MLYVPAATARSGADDFAGAVAARYSQLAKRGVLGDNAGAGYATEILDGGSGQAIAGHGYYRYGHGDITVPEGTTVLTSPYNRAISDYTGRFLENVDTKVFEVSDVATRQQMARDWAIQNGVPEGRINTIIEEIGDIQTIHPNGTIPNYTISTPNGLKVYQNSTTVNTPTQLGEILQPNAGCIALATCTKVK